MRSTLVDAQSRAAVDRLAFFAGVAGAVSIVLCFYDRFWWPPDEGVYGYVAQRLLRGDVLHRDIQDIHSAPIHFLHALAFAVFGEDLLSLRYPLGLLTVVQSVIVWHLLAERGAAVATAGAIAVAALSFVQFLNPSANWYALFFMFATAAALRFLGGRTRAATVGALIMSAFLFRQLSGVFIAMGAITFLLAGRRASAARDQGSARIVLAVVASGLVLYLLAKASITAFLIFGIWPLILIAVAWRHASGAADLLAVLRPMFVGAAAILIPLLAYHVLTGSLLAWIDDAVLAALHLTSFAFFSERSHLWFAVLGMVSLAHDFSVAASANLAFWLALLALPIAAGVMTVRVAARAAQAEWHPLPVMATFFAIVSVHYETPIYLLHSAGAVVAATLWHMAHGARGRRRGLALALFLAAVALLYHAGESPSRSTLAWIRGQTSSPAVIAGLPGARLAMGEHDQRTYGRLIDLVTEHSTICDTVLSLPMNPEINFLGRRRAPFRFYSAALGLRRAEDVDRAAAVVAARPPALLVHRRHDKYNTPSVLVFLARIMPLYRHLETVGEFDVLVPSSPPPDSRDCRARGE